MTDFAHSLHNSESPLLMIKAEQAAAHAGWDTALFFINSILATNECTNPISTPSWLPSFGSTSISHFLSRYFQSRQALGCSFGLLFERLFPAIPENWWFRELALGTFDSFLLTPIFDDDIDHQRWKVVEVIKRYRDAGLIISDQEPHNFADRVTFPVSRFSSASHEIGGTLIMEDVLSIFKEKPAQDMHWLADAQPQIVMGWYLRKEHRLARPNDAKYILPWDLIRKFEPWVFKMLGHCFVRFIETTSPELRMEWINGTVADAKGNIEWFDQEQERIHWLSLHA